MTFLWILAAVLAVLAAISLYDVLQKKHAILRNFPIIGHFRYLLESVGPELRQYIVTDNDEERPFSRDQRTWVYTAAKEVNTYRGFGTDNDLELAPNYVVVLHSAFPKTLVEGDDPQCRLPCAKVLGETRGRAHAFQPDSLVNISAMSFGSLSSQAIRALNRGAKLAGCLHNTGEGGVSPYHLEGGDLIWQIGTGYFGCRDPEGRFDLDQLKETVERAPIRALEIKLSQGAKPGHGGVLPAKKITKEIAEIRGIPMGEDCLSPAGHSAFGSVDEMLDFVELLASETGLPVGVKSAVGDLGFWRDLANAMERDSGRGVDFVTIDGGEGGTGAAPLAFTDHVALPFKIGFTRVYREFAARDLHRRIVWIGSGKLGFPETALFAFAVGCDMVNVAREAMLSIGCIQAQRCHTDHCPTGVATQNRWLVRGLDPELKSVRAAAYIRRLRHELLALSHACGVDHPSEIDADSIEVLDAQYGSRCVRQLFGYEPGWGAVAPDRVDIPPTE